MVLILVWLGLLYWFLNGIKACGRFVMHQRGTVGHTPLAHTYLAPRVVIVLI